eukprot:TRINITY_DN17236_c0_g1_i9.p1 TRINITY_DN17236_c0_g1~~TRINITY_DN17236_c0_g1_i9.p1  ORF type:complete len:795 (+),score=216.77 TRINITY_DN17236_c0_g1_i9:104-2488(+)
MLFYDSYSKFPPARLMHVLNGFIDSLEAGSNATKAVTLQLLAKITYDTCSYLYVAGWRVKSYLLGAEPNKYSFSPQKIVSAISQFIKPEISQGLLIIAVDALASIGNAHYPLLLVDVSKLLEHLASNLRGLLKDEKYESLIRVIELSGQIISQRSPSLDTKGIRISTSAFCSFFSECLTLLSQIAVIFMKSIKELTKPQTSQKGPAPKQSPGDVFQINPFQLLAILVAAIMKTVSKMFYVANDDLLGTIEKIIVTMRLYTSADILAEKFVPAIQEVIAHLYYSGTMRKLARKGLLGLLDLCLQLGWRNIFCAEKQSVHSLQEHLEGKSLFAAKGSQEGEAGLSQSERRTAIAVSQLTFPNGETGQRLLEEIDTRLRIRVKEISSSYFSYQNDSSHTMHTITANIVRLFLSMNSATQSEVLDYLSRIMRQEIENEQSMVLQQSILLMELLGWYSFSNTERTSSANSFVPAECRGKLWILGDSLIYAEAEGQKAVVRVRNIVSSTAYTLLLQEPVLTSPQDAKETKESLETLREKGSVSLSVKEQEAKIEPEHILNNLPSISLRVTERNPGWDAVEVKGEISTLIESLDAVPVYDTHSIGVIYVPPNSDFTEESLYSAKVWSKRFETFLAELGSLVSVKDCANSYMYLGNMPLNGSDGKYGLVWQDKLTQIFFHVNILMQHIDETVNNYRNLHGKIDAQEEAMVTQILSSISTKSPEESKASPLTPGELQKLVVFKIRRHLQSDNVLVLWNESGGKVPLEIFKGKTSVFIVIDPLTTGYCAVKKMTVILFLLKSRK